MDDFIGIIVLAVIYMVAAASFRGRKRGKEKKRGKRESAGQPQFDEAFGSAQTVLKAAPSRKESLPRRESVSHAADADCERKPLHLHEVTRRQFDAAGEGDDPCHAGRAPGQARSEPILMEETREPHPLADDVLRGVIMSEILQRPCERMARRDHRRRA